MGAELTDLATRRDLARPDGTVIEREFRVVGKLYLTRLPPVS
jgi:hypothetical protein